MREALYAGDRAGSRGSWRRVSSWTCSTRPRSAGSTGCEQLLDADPALVAALSDDGFTPLHLACFAGGADAVRLLVERGAPLERLAEASFARVRPLGTAVFAGQVEAAEILLEAGADPNGVDSGENVPLQTAEANGNEELARLLREHGATLPV